MRIAITGGSGTLGRRLRACPLLAGAEVFAPGHAEMDVADEAAVERFVERRRPDALVHCAAIIRSRNANSPEMWAETTRVNVFGTGVVARACARRAIRLVYVSTDFVFDGSKPGGMYVEEDLPAPLGYYPLSKYAGEQLARECRDALIVRTSFCDDAGWPYPRAFVDRFTSKERASVIAGEILLAARSDLVGVVHVGGPRRSYFEFAQTLSRGVEPMTMADLKTNDPMPIDTSLDTSRWREYKRRQGLAP